MDNYQPQVDEFGLYISPYPSGPSSLDYCDRDFPITGAVTTAESAPHFDAAVYAWLTTPIPAEGGGRA